MRKNPLAEPDYRPNTRKMYEEHHGICVLPGVDIHHELPLRHGGKHEVSNLVALWRDEHAKAHLELYERFGDPRDLCASYMISGRTEEAALLASSMGGKASQIAKRERGEANGFQLFTPERRREIAAAAGRIGGAVQKEQGIGIHTDEKTRAEWARLGALAVMERNGFLDPDVQSERGKRGGVKNKGFKWCHNGAREFKYTAAQQTNEPFDAYLARTGLLPGKLPSNNVGSRFYNNGSEQWMFRPTDHTESFEEFLEKNKFKKGRLK